MSRTPIPPHLVHRSSEVNRNAHRFDQLCSVAQEVALPVVRQALIRETAETGARTLSDEAKLALKELVDEAVLEGFDEPEVLDEIQNNLECAIPKPDDEECHAYARDATQVLMSAWLEILRKEFMKPGLMLRLSDQLLPTSSTLAKIMDFVSGSKLPSLTDAVASLALNEQDTGAILSNLRLALFSVEFKQARLVELPFELVLAGSALDVVATTRRTYDAFLLKRNLRPIPAPSASASGMSTSAPFSFSPQGEGALADLTINYLSTGDYKSLHDKASSR